MQWMVQVMRPWYSLYEREEKLLSFSRDIHCICRQMLDLKKARILRQTMQKHVEQFEKWILSISSEIEELIQSLNEASSFVVPQTVNYFICILVRATTIIIIIIVSSSG